MKGDFLSSVGQILGRWEVAREESRRRGEEFNLFRVCGVDGRENSHSALLAELLSPCGSHGQGALFLEQFLDVLGTGRCPWMAEFDLDSATVQRECAVSEGRIDILVSDGKRALVIENKIYAADQWEQLKRYERFARTRYGAANYLILYLTLGGEAASEQSGLGVAYTTISYKEDVLKWLNRSLSLCVDKSHIREVLIQYMELLKQLTGQGMESGYQKELLQAMIANAEEVDALFEARSECLKYTWTEYARPQLCDVARRNGLLWEEYNMTGECWDRKCLKFRKPEWKKCCIQFESDGKYYPPTNFYCGICSADGEVPGVQQKLDCFSDAPNSGWPYGNSWLDAYRNWDIRTAADMKNGKYAAYIERTLKTVLEEIAAKGILLP